MLISTGIYWGSLNTLLNHSQPVDEESKVVDRIAGIYWPIVTALSLVIVLSQRIGDAVGLFGRLQL